MRRIGAAALAVMLALPGAAYSQFTNPKESAWYIGGSLGEGTWKDWCEGVTVSCDKKDEVWRIFGGFKFNRWFSAELGYADLGKVNFGGPLGNARGEATAWDVVGLLSLPLGPFSIYGKFGGYYGDIETSSTVAAFGFTRTGSASDTNTDITYGAGVQFDFTRNLAIRGEWQRYEGFGGTEVGGETDMDVYSVGLLWRF
jgi:OOP family OmpA-OmpF porin